MQRNQSPGRRQRIRPPGWAGPIAAAVVVFSVGMWLGTTTGQARITLPTLVSRTKAGFQQLRAAVRSRLGIGAADASDHTPRTQGHPSRKPPRVVPLRPTGSGPNPQGGKGRS